MSMNRLQKAARLATVSLLHEGDHKRSWSVIENRLWTRAFNALNALAGKKIRLKKPTMVTGA